MILLILFWTFFKIGAFTFGGGYAMLPLIQAEVSAHQWMNAEELVNFIAVSESTPGPFAVNVATYVGMTVGGLSGAFFSTLSLILPSFVIILIVAKCFEKFRSSKIVSGCMSGLKPAVIGLIGTALLSVGKTVFFPNGIAVSALVNPKLYCSLVLFVAMSVLAFKKVHPILIICISALVGIAAGYLLPLLG